MTEERGSVQGNGQSNSNPVPTGSHPIASVEDKAAHVRSATTSTLTTSGAVQSSLVNNPQTSNTPLTDVKSFPSKGVAPIPRSSMVLPVAAQNMAAPIINTNTNTPNISHPLTSIPNPLRGVGSVSNAVSATNDVNDTASKVEAKPVGSLQSNQPQHPQLQTQPFQPTNHPNPSTQSTYQSGSVSNQPKPISQNISQPVPQTQPQKRKLVLTEEGRKALTDAVLSSLKNNGQMDPVLLKTAMEITKLSQSAILNAATMARQREEEKKKQNLLALQQQKQRQAQLQQQQVRNTQTSRIPISSDIRSVPGVRPVPNQLQPIMHSSYPRPTGPHLTSMQQSTFRPSQPSLNVSVPPFRQNETAKQSVSTITEAQVRSAAAMNEQMSKEVMHWNRIHHGFFTSTTGPTVENQQKIMQLGAVSRCNDKNPVLGNDDPTSVKQDDKFWKAIASLQSQVRQIGPLDQFKDLSESKSIRCRANFLSKANHPLLDVTDKYKRIKLQPRKESKQLEKNLRKHRQVTCETLVRKHKDWNKAIVAHSSEFYKFHRQRKFEIGKFARSVRDFVAQQERQKEKSEANEERARIAALRANDMEAYTALVQDTRNDRLKFLLDKTGEYMEEISNMLKGQQNGQVNDNATTQEGGVELVGGSRLPLMKKETTSYYQSAHVRQEEVKQPSILTFGTLKSYQVAGLKWLVSLYNNNLNGILADEMGLGKTVQTISLIAHLMEVKDNRGPYLVIVPLSTLSNWVNEFRRWCPSITVVVYKGTPAQRKGLYKSEVSEGHFNVLLTTYEYIIKDKSSLRKLVWEYAIVDEGHRMKNAQSKFAVTLSTQYETKHRVLLTGTPLQNSLPELWSLLNFLLPSVFNSVETFDQWFNKPFEQFGSAATDVAPEETINTEERLLIIQRLHELLRPFMLRRIKSDVLDQLPDKVEKVLRCELSSWQKELYKQISYSILEDGQRKSSRGMNNVVMQLRKVCNHPYMFTPEGYYINDDIIRTSGKFELLDRMLPKLKAAGHRILMFFQMTAAMTIMEDYFKHRGILSLRLDGSTAGEERERRMDLFNAPNSPYFVFMLSTRAGGLGLNLVSADTVIIFDSDWNPMMDLQAQDRAHRIGQKKIVSVFRLITNSPVEEKILSRASEKMNMSELVVEAGGFGDAADKNEDQAEERQKIMELLLTDFDSNARGTATGSLPTSEDEGEEDTEGENEEIDLNELLSRNDEDYDFYTKMDSGEIKVDDFYKSPGLATDPNEIPDWIRYPHGPEGSTKDIGEDGILIDPNQKRASAQAARYTDGMTEKQFLRAMEKQAQAEEDAIKARKAEWKEKRELKISAAVDVDTAVKTGSTALSKQVVDRLISMCKSVIALRDPKTKRRLSDMFREKPSRDEYPQYYQIIENPIGINDIMRKCRAFEYTSVREFHSDWSLLFNNALKFNGEGSWIVEDSKVLENELNRLITKHKMFEQESPPKKLQKPRIKLSLKNLVSKRKKDESSDGCENGSPRKKKPKMS